MSIPLTLRIVSPEGKKVILNVNSNITFSILKQKCCEILSLNYNLLEPSFDLLWGFPPTNQQEINNLNDDRLIHDYIKHNESLKIQLKESIGKQAQGESYNKKTKSDVKYEKQKNKTNTSPIISNKPAFGARIATIHRTIERKRVREKTTRKRVNKTKGSSEQDICEHLISAVSVGSTGTRNKMLKKVFRDAVSHQYDDVKSVVRLEATYSGKK
jgi:hypothetical protein